MMSIIHPGIWAQWADSVSSRINSIASRDQFKPIRIGENLMVNYNWIYCCLFAVMKLNNTGFVREHKYVLGRLRFILAQAVSL